MDKSDFRWINLTPIWSICEKIGQERGNQKGNFSSTNDWKKNNPKSIYTHTIGFAGEIVGALMTRTPLDATLRIEGDGGIDLEDGTDVKTTVYWPPILKHPQNAKHWPKFFALVYLDEATKIGYFIGKVTKEDLFLGELRAFGDNQHLNYTLTMEEVVEKNINKRNKV